MQVRMGLLNKHPDWSTEQFRAYWREEHSKLASQLPGLLAYQQNHVTDTAQRGISYKRGPESVDGISQLWFDDSMRMHVYHVLAKHREQRQYLTKEVHPRQPGA